MQFLSVGSPEGHFDAEGGPPLPVQTWITASGLRRPPACNRNETHASFCSGFPHHVCPEPVLAKRSLFFMKRKKRKRQDRTVDRGVPDDCPVVQRAVESLRS
jgi:hypothetical protein